MTNKNSSKMEVPQAKEAMNRFKMEVANEIGVNLKDGYNGDLTSREAGSMNTLHPMMSCFLRTIHTARSGFRHLKMFR